MMSSSATNMGEVATAAYRLSTDGLIAQAQPWQADLYECLSAVDSEAGYLLLTPTGAGRTESVVIPALGLRRGGAPRRLFLIAPDGAPLDDALYRVVPYLRAFVAADGVPRTLCLDAADDESDENVCRRFLPDGREEASPALNPLEADVDLVLTTFSRFRALFFGSGGIHALPSTFAPDDGSPVRRDLFFFDEAHSYVPDAFARFHRLIEFLFAEDTDIVVGSSTMPPAFQEELSFLERIAAPETNTPARTLTYQPAGDPRETMEQAIRRAYYQNSRVIGVTEDPQDAIALHARLAPAYPHGVYLYHPGQSPDERRRTYAQLRELEKEGEGYLLLTTGAAIEAADLDATVLLTTLCPPEALIRRAGRCNRRGDLSAGQITVVGGTFAPDARPLNAALMATYRAALRAHSDAPFDADFWKQFI